MTKAVVISTSRDAKKLAICHWHGDQSVGEKTLQIPSSQYSDCNLKKYIRRIRKQIFSTFPHTPKYFGGLRNVGIGHSSEIWAVA